MSASTTGRVYTGRSAAERDADRKERLLKAGHQLFGTAGYSATSIEHLCSTASVSTRHFYLLFPNKEECFLAVYDKVTSESLTLAVNVLAETVGAPIRERASKAFLAYVRPLLADPKSARISFIETVVVGAVSEEHHMTFREALVSTIVAEGEAAVARGEVTDRNFRVAALALIGGAGAVVTDWARGTDAYAMDELERELNALAIKILTE